MCLNEVNLLNETYSFFSIRSAVTQDVGIRLYTLLQRESGLGPKNCKKKIA